MKVALRAALVGGLVATGLSLSAGRARGEDRVAERIAALLDRYRAAKEAPGERIDAVLALASLAQEAGDKAIGEVLLAEPAEVVRLAAVAALGSRATETAARLALGGLRASDPYVAEAIGATLARRCHPKAVSWIVEHGFAPDASPELRAASVAIVAAHLKPPEARRLLHKLSADASPLVRAAVARALGALEPAGAPLDGLAQDAEIRVRVVALEALAATPGEKAAKRLRDTLERDAAFQARVAAARALGARAPRDVAPLLKVVREGKADPRVRIACLEELARERTKGVVTDLVAVVKDGPGRPETDLRRVLRLLTGTDPGTGTAADWRSWWDTSKDAYRLPDAPPANAAPRDRTQARFYDLPLESTRVCFLLDGSGSMTLPDARAPGGRTKFQVACAELRKALDALPPGAAFGVIVFGPRTIAIAETPQPVGPEAIRRVLADVEAVKPSGGTDLHAALSSVFHASEPGDPAGASAVVFDTVAVLSDGLPTTGTVTEPGELRRRVRDWNRFARVRLHAVAVGDSADLLAGLAADSGGASVVR